MENQFEYSAVIRTLGTAGEKYQKLLDSLNSQTIKPRQILVYIAEGYSIPKETIGYEQYIYVKKGMVAQRALQYQEINTEYILFLDDDVLLSYNSVEMLYNYLKKESAAIIAPDVFPNADRPILNKVLMAVSGRMCPRYNDKIWGYKVMRNSGYSYNNNPKSGVYLSETNAGPCFFCRKKDFLKIRFEEELWLDRQKYPLGEDQVMFYKMHLLGLKQLTLFGSGIKHLDAGSTLVDEDKKRTLIFADLYFKLVFWHRFIYMPDSSLLSSMLNILSIFYLLMFTLSVSFLKFNFKIMRLKCKAIKDAVSFIRSNEYKNIPLIKKINKK